MRDKLLASAYFFAFLIGMYPILFFLGNNWFMFELSQALVLFMTFSLIIFMTLSSFYLGLSWIVRNFLENRQERITNRFFVLISLFVLAYLLRHTFLEMLNGQLALFLLLVLSMASILAWFVPRVQIFRLNIILGIMCLVQIGMVLDSVITRKAGTPFEEMVDEAHQILYDEVKFLKKPNVYYIIPDGHPDRETVRKIFHVDETDFYERLESLGFTIYPSVFSNYMATLYSVSSLLGMNHHYYRGSIGNFEMLDSRTFIASAKNPVVRIFKKNGYQVSYVHETDYLLRKGCLVDSCSPKVARWGALFDILVAPRLHSIPLIKQIVKPINAVRAVKSKEKTLSDVIPKILKHIDLVSVHDMPHFTFIHTRQSGHSSTGKQTYEELTSFRKNYFKRIQIANDTVTNMVKYILTRDPNALIILNADHGAWGYGNLSIADRSVFEEIPDDLIARDHLGVLLAIHWPDAPPNYTQDIRSNVNLFRYIFSYLSESQAFIATKVRDDGYLIKGRGKDGIVMKVLDDGDLLKQMVELSPVK